MTHPSAPSTERLREAEELAEAILSAAGSHLRHYMPASKAEIIDVAVRKLDALTQENARLREALQRIAAFDEEWASIHLANTGSYSGFDEPGSVEIGRRALNGGTSDAE